MLSRTFDPGVWAAVPFHFWSVIFFCFGCMVGSFLNVCIHRLPLGESIVSPPSHCPHCKYAIPWYLNIPLVTWLYLRGKCRNCGAPISMRYFLVELVTGVAFLGCWLRFGHQTPWLPLVLGLFLAALIVGTFIDYEHLIIPDEITLGGVVVGMVLSFLVPDLHGTAAPSEAVKRSLVGVLVGSGLVYLILRAGKLFFGRHRMALEGESKIVFTENSLELPDRSLPYEDIFYRHSDVVVIKARRVELVDRCYKDAVIRLSPATLQIDEEKLNPEQVLHMEAVSDELVLPREAMGLGDVKFMAAIGAFLGWQSVIFSIIVSSFIGAVVGLTLVALRRRDLSSRLPYGPYIAAAATIWIFAGPALVEWYRHLILRGAGAGPG